MELNNKGFAVSTILYGILVIFFLVVALLMSILSTNRKVTTNLIDQIDRELNDYSDSIGYKPNQPELVTGMIPIKYDDTKKVWVKSGIDDDAWYDYYNQRWANAALVKEESRAEYQTAERGTEIPLDDMLVMLVWIPRYSYAKKGNYGYAINSSSSLSETTPGAFNIRFVTSDITNLGVVKYTSDEPTEGDYYTPTSFCWGDKCETDRLSSENKEISGFWVSKFELGVNNKNKASCAIASSECDSDEIVPYSIPNITSWRYARNVTFFNSIKKRVNGEYGNRNFGLSGSYDAHMIKNTEWGTIAILTQSKYGKYGKYINEGKAQVDAEVTINNCSKYITGISGDSVSASSSSTCTNTYDTSKGQMASTTGTIYGIYDMSGGAWEFVMGHYGNDFNESTTGGFTSATPPETKYYNLYNNDMGIYGDATRIDAMIKDKNGNWISYYSDEAIFPSADSPWFIRGGMYSKKNIAGIFAFKGSTGSINSSIGTRLTIKP